MPQIPCGTAFEIITNIIVSLDMLSELRYNWLPHKAQREAAFQRLPDHMKHTALGQVITRNIEADPVFPWTQELKLTHLPKQVTATVIINDQSTTLAPPRTQQSRDTPMVNRHRRM
jgi:hypothetical protein